MGCPRSNRVVNSVGPDRLQCEQFVDRCSIKHQQRQCVLHASKRRQPSSTTDSVDNGSRTNAPAERSSLSRESAAIEAERSELKQMSERLDSQKQDLDAESTALDEMQSYAKSVQSTYAADTVPESVRDRYNSTIDDYNRRLPSYKRAVRDYNEAVEEFERRRTEFNARVQRYNASR